MPQEMTEREGEQFVLDLLRHYPHLTTKRIEEEARKRNATCPDAIIRFLNKMKLKGLIKGRLSIEERGWIWYLMEKTSGDQEERP